MIIFCFYDILSHWVQNCYSFFICMMLWRHDVMSWRHTVTKPDLPISACICTRKLILFLFPWFFRSPSSKMLLMFYLYDPVTSWRHVMTSQSLNILYQLVYVLESWFFFVSMFFFKSLSSNIWMIFNFVYVLASWRHVMTWRQYLSSPNSTYWSCSWAIVRFL